MRRFKKLKKYFRPPVSPAVPSHTAVGVPGSSAEVDPGEEPEGINKGRGSSLALRNSDEGRRPDASNALTRAAEPQDNFTSTHEQEGGKEGKVPSNVTDAGFNHNPLSAEGDLEVQTLQERETQGTVTTGPTASLTEHLSEDDHLQADEDAHGTVQPEKPKVAEENQRDRAIEGAAILIDEEITRRFNPLKSILSAVHTNYEEYIPIGNKIGDLISRINALEEHFESCPRDIEEQRGRGDVISKFKDIEGRLRVLSEEPRTEQQNGLPQGDGDLFGLFEDLREIISDYRMTQQKKIYDQECILMNPDDAAVLNGFRSARGAEFRQSGRRGCLKGTRGAVLDDIELWTRDSTKPPVYWLNGLAGTGKTTIAMTIAERTFADGQLGASFFCSRDFEDRSNINSIFPTLAVQLARKYADFRSHLLPLVRSNPGIAHESLYDQMSKLIVRPLKESKISSVIIIDALDECKDDEPASAILSILGRFVSEIPKAKFFVTGRPEPRIREGFRLPVLAKETDVFVLHDAEPSQVDKDIRLFFSHTFSDLVRRRGLGDWPTKEQLDLLCERAAGLFVYAVATVKFIDKASTNPRRQLDLLLQSPESSTREAKTKFTGNTTLDSLYTSILQEAFGNDNDTDNDPRVRSVLGATILAANPLSPSAIAKVLGLDVEDVFPLLSSARSLLILQEDIDCPVRPFHKSFPDFLTDPDRCTDQRFHVFPPDHHSQLFTGCLNLMDRMLDRNMCRLPDGVANSDIPDLKERVGKFIDPAVQYACRSWHTHLVEGPTTSVNAEIPSTLHRFLEKKLLFWLEVLSALGAVRNAVDALQVATSLLKESPTLDLADDCYRFVTGYFEIISASSPHIYHSALVVSPKTSIVRKLYESYAQPFVRVVHGLPVSWDQHIATIACPSSIRSASWSLCNRFIAIAAHGVAPVDILDSATLQRLQTLKPPPGISALLQALIFSPDGHMLTCFGCQGYGGRVAYVVSWDLQTGGVVSAIKHRGPEREIISEPCITYSKNGRMVGVLCPSGVAFVISIYDVVSGVHVYDVDWNAHRNSGPLNSKRLEQTWTHGEFLRFTTTESSTVTVWEVGFTPEAAPTQVEALSVLNDGYLELEIKGIQITSESHRIAFYSNGPMDEVRVWDTRDSKFLLRHPGRRYSLYVTFSSDGRFFACAADGSEIHLWKEDSTGYTLHGKLVSGIRHPTPLLSPNGESIITFGDSMVRLWHTKKTLTIPSNADPHHIKDFSLAFLPNRPSVVFTRQDNNVVEVFNLESGVLELTIDAGMPVHGVAVVGNSVVTICGGKVVTWDLLGRKSLPDARMGPEDSTQTISFRDEPFTSMRDASISPDFRQVVILASADGIGLPRPHLRIYNLATGRDLTHPTRGMKAKRVSPGDDNLWYVAGDKVEVWALDWDATPPVAHKPECEPRETPWGSSRGYEVTDDGWILGPGGKRLLMLPPPWQSRWEERMWNGQFLALLHGSLPEPVILDLEP